MTNPFLMGSKARILTTCPRSIELKTGFNIKSLKGHRALAISLKAAIIMHFLLSGFVMASRHSLPLQSENTAPAVVSDKLSDSSNTKELRGNVDTRTIFHLLKHLTRQNSVTDLVAALTELLAVNFSGVRLTVYELRTTRSEYSKLQCIICLDTVGQSPALYLNDEEDMYRTYLEKTDQSVSQNGQTTLLMPVELYDKSISHLIKVSHPYVDTPALDLLTGLIDIFRDIFRNQQEKSYDPLTRILNRQAFDQIASDLAYGNRKMQHNTSPFSKSSFKAVAILDIDRFKHINDQFGHAIGDETLVLFAQTVRLVLRQEDMFFRYGGEEFVIFVKDVDFERAYGVLERCRESIESRRFPQVGQVTVSIGFADLAPNTHPVETLSKADKALYYVKQNGRNQVRSYEELLRNGQLTPIEINQGSVDFWD